MKQSLAGGHAAANPTGQLGCAGRRSYSRLALASEAPGISGIISRLGLLASCRPVNRSRRFGDLAASTTAFGSEADGPERLEEGSRRVHWVDREGSDDPNH